MYITSVLLPVTVCPDQTAVSVVVAKLLTCCAVAMPMEVKLPEVALDCEVMMPVVPSHSGPPAGPRPSRGFSQQLLERAVVER